jgi:hypothetical protein
MTKKKKNKISVRRIVENRKLSAELKRLNTEPRPLIKEKDGTLMPRGWQNMSPLQTKIDVKRRAKHLHYSRTKKEADTISAVFCFMPSEIGLTPPSEEEIKMVEAIDKKLAKKLRNFNPLDHAIYQPILITRKEGLSLKEQWKHERELVRNYIIEQRAVAQADIQRRQQEVQYNPQGNTTIDLESLTTAGEKNEHSFND